MSTLILCLSIVITSHLYFLMLCISGELWGSDDRREHWGGDLQRGRLQKTHTSRGERLPRRHCVMGLSGHISRQRHNCTVADCLITHCDWILTNIRSKNTNRLRLSSYIWSHSMLLTLGGRIQPAVDFAFGFSLEATKHMCSSCFSLSQLQWPNFTSGWQTFNT